MVQMQQLQGGKRIMVAGMRAHRVLRGVLHDAHSRTCVERRTPYVAH